MHKGKSPHCAQSQCCVPSAPVFITLLFLHWERSWLKTSLRVLRMWTLCICDVNWMKHWGRNKRSTHAMAISSLWAYNHTNKGKCIVCGLECELFSLRSKQLHISSKSFKSRQGLVHNIQENIRNICYGAISAALKAQERNADALIHTSILTTIAWIVKNLFFSRGSCYYQSRGSSR